MNPEFDVDYVIGMTPDQLNKKIVDFNLEIQGKFKKSGHQELYMMDDTQTMNPDGEIRTIESDKKYMHGLNGKDAVTSFNSSQMNVLFPFKKMTAKSLYSSQLKVMAAKDIDDSLETARGITL